MWNFPVAVIIYLWNVPTKFLYHYFTLYYDLHSSCRIHDLLESHECSPQTATYVKGKLSQQIFTNKQKIALILKLIQFGKLTIFHFVFGHVITVFGKIKFP